jgi:hypothetical protein
LLEAQIDPIFTPPWNRCTAATGSAVLAAGLSVLSSESHATRLAAHGLAEVPVSVDWFARGRGTRLTRGELGSRLAERARPGGSVGVLLHHALMDAAERADLGALLALLTRADTARVATIAELAPAGVVR